MKVSELANELGTTSKEILEIIKKNDPSAKLFAATKLTEAQENAVRGSLSAKKSAPSRQEAGQEGKTSASEAAEKSGASSKPEAAKQENQKPEAGKTDGQAPKKKLTAVFRPQNAQQQIKRPVPKPTQAPNRSQAAAGAKSPAAEGNQNSRLGTGQTDLDRNQPARENRDGNRNQGNFQGGRDGRENRDRKSVV